MTKISTSRFTCLFAALLLLNLPLRWLLSWLAAAAIHESFHILAILAFRGRIFHIRIGITGAVMEVSPLSPGKELICALAGPMGGLLLLSLAGICPTIALCALVQSLWNLLPIYPMDGGRMLQCVLCMLFGHRRGAQIGNATGNLVRMLLLLLAIDGTLRRGLGLLPLIIAGMLIFRFFHEKLAYCNRNTPEFFEEGESRDFAVNCSLSG